MKAFFRETRSTIIPFLRWIILCLGILYLCSGIYAVSSNEIAMLQRFGKVVDDSVQPGIHAALPWPIDRVTKVPVKIINRIVIDDFSSMYSPQNSSARAFSSMTGLDTYCITGDNNLINILCVIQYTITDPFGYVFRIQKPELMLRNMAANTIIHCIAGKPIDTALTRGKLEIGRYIKRELQKRLQEVQSGLSVSFVELRDIKPPDRVQKAFSDVVKAGIDRIKMINQAEAYRNEKIPAAKADANRLLQDAEAYKREVVLRAEGDASRFISLLGQVEKKGGGARTMLYIETMQQIMKQVDTKHIMLFDAKGRAPARIKLFSGQ